MPHFTFNDLQKQPYKYADINILRTVDLTVWLMKENVYHHTGLKALLQFNFPILNPTQHFALYMYYVPQCNDSIYPFELQLVYLKLDLYDLNILQIH